MGASLGSLKNVCLSGAMMLPLTEIKTVTGHIRLVKLDLFCCCCCCCWLHCMACGVLVRWLNWTQALAVKALIPNHWTTWEFPVRLVVDIAFTANWGSSMWKCQVGLERYLVLGFRRQYWARNSDLVIISALIIIHVRGRIVTRFSVFKNCSYVLKQGTSLVAQIIENLPSVQEAWVRSLVWEGTLEKEMATHSRILAWRIPKRRKTRWLKKILDILHSMWAPNSPTRDITCVPCTGNRVLTTGPPGKFQWDHFFLLNFCTVRMQSASVPNVNARCVSVYAQESN